MLSQTEVIAEHITDYMEYGFLDQNGIDTSSMREELEIQLKKGT